MSTDKLILNGQTVADFMKEDMASKVAILKKRGIQPCLATILVGDDPSSATYVRMKGNACARIGVHSIKVVLSADTTTEELIQEINKLNDDPSVHGILLQHPVPNHIDERAAFDTISIEKDVDGVTTLGFALNAFGEAEFPSCTPQAIMRILDFYNIQIEGKHAVVIGRSPILGKPVSAMLLNRNATVTTCHSKTMNLEEIVKLGDIIIAAVGKPLFVKGEWIKSGAVVIDAGYNKGNVGDVDYDTCFAPSSAITPVPGGVGPVTIATLIEHTIKSAFKTI
ncbi:bifunctional 5,10-methylene-tetrahydrofolate dehydrogenase/5,10-methylene-tetrahydrofolate cyclohydrolase [Paenibacillus sp. JNUCC31]|uniref:bifunctional 5,10-methylenetetrahydrofolate dehydrogenase/5,10-methenyltetrahydrofolate cyclohydrolase n=1 Tax=Paenibacillus sp. JNUCC-31 TaxID=2777983 RepID=UPI00177D3455|nr:tetrahydrofolate dehydrogenase/cyclohydrolase catalytic domain-containing protein [Paenibacillus sp. JNUCC-31]QOS78958.1 bifunctional 5,10-methylene-tetrahydrofolate dehydrogenase/5,10-methylene-tetrahydrofolate cyclohydrolase [Paenibacillus sp. JNUCC-31]